MHTRTHTLLFDYHRPLTTTTTTITITPCPLALANALSILFHPPPSFLPVSLSLVPPKPPHTRSHSLHIVSHWKLFFPLLPFLLFLPLFSNHPTQTSFFFCNTSCTSSRLPRPSERVFIKIDRSCPPSPVPTSKAIYYPPTASPSLKQLFPLNNLSFGSTTLQLNNSHLPPRFAAALSLCNNRHVSYPFRKTQFNTVVCIQVSQSVSSEFLTPKNRTDAACPSFRWGLMSGLPRQTRVNRRGGIEDAEYEEELERTDRRVLALHCVRACEQACQPQQSWGLDRLAKAKRPR